MIGKYTEEDFFKKLTVPQQRDYLISLVQGLTSDQAKELYDHVNKARFEALSNIDKKDYYNPDIAPHFWEEK